MKTETLIIGGGIAGLRVAQLCHEKQKPFHLIEARNRWGGRMLTEHHHSGAFDLGPAWFWLGQPRMAALAKAQHIEVFEQYAKGHLSYEDEHGVVQRGRGHASMQGSLRLAGGFGALTDAMVNSLPRENLVLNYRASYLRFDGDSVLAQTTQGEITAQRVVLAVPPRLIAQHIHFEPPLHSSVRMALQSTPTWMAGQAKAMATYETAFWREDGLSGDAMSKRGPLVEVHDASPLQGPPFALFGFIGVPPQHRQNAIDFRAAVLQQLGRLFGEKASQPLSLIIKDWAFDTNTATLADQLPLYAHPNYGMPHELEGLWDNRLLFAATEFASQFGGYAEGALEAAEIVLLFE
jgi:monoamine oxidase